MQKHTQPRGAGKRDPQTWRDGYAQCLRDLRAADGVLLTTTEQFMPFLTASWDNPELAATHAWLREAERHQVQP